MVRSALLRDVQKGSALRAMTVFNRLSTNRATSGRFLPPADETGPMVRRVAENLSRQPFFWACVVLALILVTRGSEGLANALSNLGDTDDAVRIMQVRALLDGWDWYNLTNPQIGWPDALESRWSRFVDLPIALLISLFAIVLPSGMAETAARIVWPHLVLLPLLYVFMRNAAPTRQPLHFAIAAFILFGSAIAVVQFAPGRIDHHNVQLACAVIGFFLLGELIARHQGQPVDWTNAMAGLRDDLSEIGSTMRAAARADRTPDSGADPRSSGGVWTDLRTAFNTWRGPLGVGAVFGLGACVGYEALVLVGVFLATAIVLACFDVALRRPLGAVLFGFTGVLWLGLALTVPPAHWLTARCDALSLNIVLLTTSGAAAYALLLWKAGRAPAAHWLAGLAGGGLIGLALFLAPNPACAGGPFAEVNETARTLWLANVSEARSLLSSLERNPAWALSYLVFAAAGVAAAVWTAREGGKSDAIYRAIAITVTTLFSLIMMRAAPYAVWLAIPAVMAMIVRLPSIQEVPARTVQLGAAFLIHPVVLMLALTPPLKAMGLVQDAKSAAPLTKSCRASAEVAKLGQLPAGLVMSELDLSAHIAAHTRHRVVAAPYHWIDEAIATNVAMFYGPPEAAAKTLARVAPAYVAVCAAPAAAQSGDGSGGASQADGESPAASAAQSDRRTFAWFLKTGRAPDYLTAIDVGQAAGAYHVFRLDRDRLEALIPLDQVGDQVGTAPNSAVTGGS